MPAPTRQRGTLVAVAAGCLVIGSLLPSVAGAAHDALNADRVDGKHAVGAGATTEERKGNLVATSGSTGRLPNDIIARAPDAAQLRGMPLRQVRTQWLASDSDGAIRGTSPAAKDFTVTHPSQGVYCVTADGVEPNSVSGSVHNGSDSFGDFTMILGAGFESSACPGKIRVQTAKAGALFDADFTLTFAFAP